MGENEAAWITAPAAYPFTVNSAPKPKPGAGEVVIKNAAVAINPVDWKIQSLGGYINKYPFILGEDAAGIVEDVGPGVSRFKKGHRVIAHCNGLMTQDPANSSFQLYPVVTEALVAELPDSLTFEEGSVLPLAISTACAGLYQKDRLGLPLPVVDGAEPTGQTIVVWGGASSVGATVIQLAVASGVTVLTTASPANHDFVKSLGAQIVFDYRSSDVVQDTVKALASTNFAGVYDAISEDTSFKAISAILDGLNMTVNVASVLPYDKPTERFAPKYVNEAISATVLAYSIIQEPHSAIGEWIWGKYVPLALANGSFKAKPEPLVVGNGLKDIQKGLDVQKKGVSAKKVVIAI
ncbi:chaperonin 10-like protein [Penicillium atrosanguineum]|uniref:Chaperonin 10-like protein n=1 Tax=Penicillium atrosanguineum TaxID=1132637 RepID=A0A9W9GRV2_9EURO|nr:chaperonin 10-like protein [Penicillium atrosanguineum]KAJ5148000.1 chaperonin 10-like protein [Penicillium atrosanguineum]KAJ5330703.1 chaperonin 10-like protein [Penicillium atrosanguineum]